MFFDHEILPERIFNYLLRISDIDKEIETGVEYL